MLGRVLSVTPTDSDHSAYRYKVSEYEIPILCSKDIVDDEHPLMDIGRYKFLENKHRYNVGSFQVMPLTVPHGDCPNFAYVIDHPSCGRILFVTDCEDFPYDIPGVTTLMIEANYSEEILLRHALDGEDIRSRSETHMEINRTIACVERLKSPKLRRVVLLHLSDGLSDEKAFIKAVQEKVGDFVDVFAADKGMTLSLEKDWF